MVVIAAILTVDVPRIECVHPFDGVEPGQPALLDAVAYPEDVELVVGFDLDMTLADTGAGIVSTLHTLLSEQGVQVPTQELALHVGAILEDILGLYLPAAQALAAAGRYREVYSASGIPGSSVLPGAVESVAAVRALGGRVVVVTGKREPVAREVLQYIGLDVDFVAGGRFGTAKGEALREHGAQVYVGDHAGDMVGAVAGGAHAVGVLTGPANEAVLRAAGADVILPDLIDFPQWLDEHVLDLRLADLEQRLRSTGSLVVAFSGGADSAFLLAAAVRALGPERVVAATAVSGSLADGELSEATAFARQLGVRHVTPTTDEMAREGYRANAGDRCFFCKAELLDVLTPLARSVGIEAVATGTNADDVLAGFRPGIRAAAERGALTPLRDSGFTKSQVRAASARWGLPTWDKPAAACLSSRIAYGIQITTSGLARVDRAEAAARDWFAQTGIDVRDLRVRDLGQDRARVEVDAAALDALNEQSSVELRQRVVDAGFSSAEVDQRGFRSGSMNELLAAPEVFR